MSTVNSPEKSPSEGDGAEGKEESRATEKQPIQEEDCETEEKNGNEVAEEAMSEGKVAEVEQSPEKETRKRTVPTRLLDGASPAKSRSSVSIEKQV